MDFKGNQWYFGLKAHIGVDAKQGTVHSVVTTAANVADSTVLPEPRHQDRTSCTSAARSKSAA